MPPTNHVDSRTVQLAAALLSAQPHLARASALSFIYYHSSPFFAPLQFLPLPLCCWPGAHLICLLVRSEVLYRQVRLGWGWSWMIMVTGWLMLNLTRYIAGLQNWSHLWIWTENVFLPILQTCLNFLTILIAFTAYRTTGSNSKCGWWWFLFSPSNSQNHLFGTLRYRMFISLFQWESIINREWLEVCNQSHPMHEI